jgi:hypothetical protein
MYTDSEQERSFAMDRIIQIVRTWANHVISYDEREKGNTDPPPQPPPLLTGGMTASCKDESIKETREMLDFHLLIIIRMTFNCPFIDVRQRFNAFLTELEVAT